MNDNVVEFISSIETNTYDEFLNNATIESSYTIDCDINDYDYSWLNQVEQYIPFISNIVNDTNLPNNSIIVTYENRFIKTLIYSLIEFINEQKKLYKEHSLDNTRKELKSNINTKVLDEDLQIKISIISNKKTDTSKGESFGLSLDDRIDRVLDIANEFLNTRFMKVLHDASLVYNPINKTPLIIEETNYKKALELYNFIDNYENSRKDYNSKLINKKLNNNLLVSSFIEYQSFFNVINNNLEDNQYKLFLERLIEKMVTDSTMDQKSFKKMLTRKFDEEYSKKKNREQNIQNIFIKNIDNYNKQMKDAIRALKN